MSDPAWKRWENLRDEIDATIAERDRLQARVAWLGWAYQALHAHRREIQHDIAPLRKVARAAHRLLDADRTSWSPEHDRLASALAELELDDPDA